MDGALPIVVIALLIVAVAWRGFIRALSSPSPGGAVLITSIAYLSGTSILVLRDGTPSQLDVLRICCTFLPLFLLGYFGSQRLLGLATGLPKHRVPKVDVTRADVLACWLFFLSMTSLVVVAIYFSGTDKILAGLYGFVLAGDSEVSIMALRLNFSTGEDGYFAPGYIKQFRDILLPLATYLLLFSIPRNARRLMLIFLIVVPTVSVLMISSGERGPVMAFVLGTVYTALLSVHLGVASRRTIVVPLLTVAIVGGTIFAALSSTYTSRNYDDEAAGAILLDRIVTRVPEENSASYQVWRRGTPFPGAGWFSELTTILPGKKDGSMVVLSALLHEELGGGVKGNSVLGMWADVFFNFGWILGTFVSFLLGCLIAIYEHWVARLRTRSPAAAICGLWIAITMFNVYSPFGFVLYGPFVLSAVLVAIAYRSRRRAVAWRSAPTSAR